MLDGRDPFLIDTDTPDGALRNFFPGRTQLADFAKIEGQIKIFDTILASTGRDYIIDLTARYFEQFFQTTVELGFFSEVKKLGYRIILLFIVDAAQESLRAARELERNREFDLFIPVRNAFTGSRWPTDEGALEFPALSQTIVSAITNRRFSLRAFALGDPQNLGEAEALALKRFIYEVLQSLSNIEPVMSLKGLRR